MTFLSRIRHRLRRRGSQSSALRDEPTPAGPGRTSATPDRAAALVIAAAAHSGRSTPARIAVLADADSDSDSGQVVDALHDRYPRALIRTVQVTPGKPRANHVELAATGPFGLVVDATGGRPEERVDRLAAVFPHVRKAGVLVATGLTRRPAHLDARLSQFVGDGLQVSLARPRTGRRALRRAPAISSATVAGRDLVLQAGQTNLAVVREEASAQYFATRPSSGRIVLERAGSHLTNPTPIRQSPHDAAPRQPTAFDAPPLKLREYHDATCSVGQVVTQPGVLLPETFRHLRRGPLKNHWLDRVGRDFGRLRFPGEPDGLDGAYFHLDSEFRGHFGHALTEQISRLWAWEEAKREHPDVRALLLSTPKRPELLAWEYRLFEAAGIDRTKILLANGPVRVPVLLGATPAFSQPTYVHEDIRQVYRRIGDDLVRDAPDRDYPARMFCSRRTAKRSCHNAPDVEEFFRAHGFTIVYPEDYGLGEQVRMFRSASIVAGFAGSAMFTLSFVPETKPVIIVSSESYVARNEAMIAAVPGHELAIAWCRPDVVPGGGVSLRESMQSRFTFDPDREGVFVREVLADLA